MANLDLDERSQMKFEKSPEYMIYGKDDLIDTSDEEEYKEGGT